MTAAFHPRREKQGMVRKTDAEQMASAQTAARKRVLLKDVAYEKLLDLIISGVFPPGSFLAERRLAEILDMSKTPVKSSLERLEYEGFIKVSPQQGIVVCSASLADILELFDLRLALESMVARKLSERPLPDRNVRALETNLAGQEAALEANDLTAAAKLDAEFHLLLCETEGNRQILRMMTLVKAKLQQMSFFVSNNTRGRVIESVAEHKGIYQAIVQRDGDGARLAMEKHLESGKMILLQRG